MRMVRWMCSIKLKDRFPSRQLRERLGIDDIALVLQQNKLRWCGHVMRKEDDWVKKCIEYEVEGPRPRERPKRTWREVVEKDCQSRKLNTEDAVDRSKWRKLIKDVSWSGWVWVGDFLLVLVYPCSPGQRAVKWLCVCTTMKRPTSGVSLLDLRGTTLIGTQSFITALVFFCEAKEVSTYSTDISGQKKIQYQSFFITSVPLVTHIMGQTTHFIPTSQWKSNF